MHIEPVECKHEAKIAILDQRDSMIMESLQELKSKTDLILMQVTKVAVLEVNHSHHNEAMSRAFLRIEKLEEAGGTLGKETREFINQVKGMTRVAYWLWGAMGTGLGAMMLKILFGIGGNH
jgi:hypothetical protein